MSGIILFRRFLSWENRLDLSFVFPHNVVDEFWLCDGLNIKPDGGLCYLGS